MEQRNLEVVVISDIHLATHACKAKSVLKYLKSIGTKILVLNGDIIDSWRFTRSYFPNAHLKLVRYLIKMMMKGVKIYYISGNHDEFLRKLNFPNMGNLSLVNQLILTLDGQQTLIFHGDIFDHTIHNSKWLAKFGAASYGLLSVINNLVNKLRNFFGLRSVLIYKGIKQRLLPDAKILNNFEKMVVAAAQKRVCSTVICGHTHVPKDLTIETETGPIRYINCGDWVENFTAAEYSDQQWRLHHYHETKELSLADDEDFLFGKALLNSLHRELHYVSQ